MILLKNRDRKPSFKKGEYVEINDAGNYPMELSVDGVCEQETTTGKNLLPNNNAISQTINGITYSVNNDGSIKVIGTASARSEFVLFENSLAPKSINKNTTYKNTTNAIVILNTDDGYKVYPPKGTKSSGNATQIKQGYLRIESGTTVNETLYPQLIIKGQDETYEPYTGGQPSPSPDYPQEIKTIENSLKITSCNKNLFDEKVEQGAIGGRVGQTYEQCKTSLTTRIRTINLISLDINKNYTISIKNGYEYAIFSFDNEKKLYDCGISGFALFSSKSITFNNVPNIAIAIRKEDNSSITPSEMKNSDFQIEFGTTATPYEQHLETQITANLPEGEFIGKINDTYKDTLNVVYKDDGYYHLILNKMVDKVVLNGSETITKSGATTNEILVATLNTNGLVDGQGISNYFKYSPYVEKNKFGIYNNGKNLRFCLDIQQYATIDDFKSWLSTHNTEVYYALATPYEIDLGIVDTLLSYDKITNIFTDSDLLPQINAKYYKDFEFDKILRSGYNIDEQEYEIAKKQMANGKRKRILSSYDDCIIKINLGLLDNKTYQEYKEQLNDGEFHYWSYKYNQYKNANFILTKPSITTEYAYDDDIGIDDIEITLEKSSDVS